jgi:hypothetical protein
MPSKEREEKAEATVGTGGSSTEWVCFCPLGALKTYDNLSEGKKEEIPSQ